MIKFNKLVSEIDEIVNDSMEKENSGSNFNILQSVIKKVSEYATNNTTEIGKLFKNVVYIVINRAPLEHEEHRAFLTCINYNNIDKKGLNDILSNEDETLTEFPNTSAVVVNSDNSDNNRIKNLWIKKWKEYSDITDKLHQTGGTTFNQFLLQQVEHPLNIGVCWDESVKDDDNYIKLSDDTLNAIGLPKYEKNSWSKQILELQKDIPNFKHAPLSAITEMARHYENMQPSMTIDNNGIKSILYHLLRSYAFWGGTSFLSIPISFGRKKRQKVKVPSAILSLCTVEPIKGTEFFKWSIIAGKLFKDLIFSDVLKILEVKHQTKEVATAYSMGHFLKNRMKPISHLLSKLDDRLKYQATPNKKDYTNVISSLYNFSESINNLGYLMDLYSQLLSFENNDKQQFFVNSEEAKSRFSEKTPFNISNFCKNNSNLKYDTQGGTHQYAEVIYNIKHQASINCFIKDNNTEEFYIPLRALYDELLYEILINAAKHGVPNTTQIDIKFKEKEIIFSNLTSKKNYENLKKKLKTRNWKQIAENEFFNKTGGLDYLIKIFNIAKLGYFYLRIEADQNNHYHFKLKFQPKGYERKNIQ